MSAIDLVGASGGGIARGDVGVLAPRERPGSQSHPARFSWTQAAAPT